MIVTVTGKVAKRCPFVDEQDRGMVTLTFDVAEEVPELHQFATRLASWASIPMSHEAFTTAVLDEYRRSGCVRVVSTWTTAGLDVTCEAS